MNFFGKATANEQARKLIQKTVLQVVKTHQPETTEELIKILQQKTALKREGIVELLLELEREDLLSFSKKEAKLPSTAKEYLLSKRAPWYWAIIAWGIATTLAIFSIPENSYPAVYVRLTLGTVFILFLPGYSMVKMLFVSKLPVKTDGNDMESVERIALSLGISLALVPLVACVLNFTPWGIRLVPVTLSLLALTTAFATAGVIREYQAKMALEKKTKSRFEGKARVPV